MIRRPFIAAALTAMVATAGGSALGDITDPNDIPPLEGPAWEAFQEELNRWDDGFQAHLATSDDPILVLLGLNRLRHYDYLAFSGDAEPENRWVESISSIVRKHTHDPTILWMAAGICGGRCLGSDEIEWLAEAEPGNAAVPILDMNLEFLLDRTGPIDTPANQGRLRLASKGDRYNTHFGAGLGHLTQAFQRYAAEHPFEPSSLDSGAFDSVRGDALVLQSTSMASIFLMTSSPWSPLFDLCKAQIEAERDELIDACVRVAQLMTNASDTFATESMGRALEDLMLYRVSPNEESERHKLRRMVNKWKLECAAPASMDVRFLLTTSVDDIVQWLNEIEALGEQQAMRGYVERDFEAHPERYAVDPKKCDAFDDLDDYALDQLSRSGGISLSHDEAMKRLADLEKFGWIKASSLRH